MNARRLTFLLTFALVAMTLASITPVQAASPTVTTVDPSSGSVNGGTEVTLTGTNFEQGATVHVDGTLATGITVASGTSMKFKTPPHAAGQVGIVVTNPGGETTSFNNAFTYTAASGPTIDGVSPGSSIANGGETVTITGTNFHTDPKPLVTIGGNAAIVTAVTATEITVVAPPSTAAGTVNVVVTNPAPGSTPATLTDGFAYTASNAPTVTGLTPTSSSTDGGVEVTITGTNFAPGATVPFTTTSGVHAATKVTFISSTQLKAVAPPKAPADAGDPASIKVTNPDGKESSATTFSYAPATAPTISTVVPDQGPILGGTTVTITGTGFHKDATVTVGGVAAHRTTFVSATELRVVTPAGAAAAAVDVVVTNPSTESATDTGGFTYVDPVRIDSVSPSSGPSVGGTSVTLTGEGFEAGARVFFGSVEVPAAAVTVNPGGAAPCTTAEPCITAEAPPQAAGAKDIRVVNPDGRTARITGAFTYGQSPDPEVDAVSPNEGPNWGGVEVTITGAGFSDVTGFKPTVKFGTITIDEEKVMVDSSTQITVEAPSRSHSTDSVNLRVVVTNPDGKSSSTSSCTAGDPPPAGCFQFEPAPAPTVTDTSDDSGDSNGGEVTTITGTGFAFNPTAEDAPPKPTVKFGSVVVPEDDVTVVSATSITVKVPARASTTSETNVRVQVTNPDGRSSSGTACATGGSPVPDGCYRYTVAAAPGITTLSPENGAETGGTTVTITGTDFAYDALEPPAKPTVKFGGVTVPAGSVTVTSATELSVVTPGAPRGAVDVVVTNPDGKTATAGGAFTYLAASAPTVTTVAPPTAPSIGGTELTITGTGFATTSPVKPRVFIGTDEVDPDAITVGGATSITINDMPARTAGSAPIQVRNPDGQTGSLSNALRYLPVAPQVNSLSATTGSENGGLAVIISGSDLGSTAPSVLFGAEIARVTSSASSSIGIVTPSGSSGAVSVVLADGDGQTGTRASAFTYATARPSTFTSLSPVTGSVNGGATITVTGQNFVSTATVTVGGLDATGVSASSDGKTLTFVAPSHSLGPKDIVITNPAGPALTIERGFGYLGTAGPTLSSVSPGSGPTSGGTSVTLTGANFVSGATVRFGGTAATGVTVDSATTITATTPSGSAGDVTVTVTNPDGQQASLADAFEYEGDPAPTVTEVDPDTGGSNGGTEVTITGTGFLADARVTFGGTESPDVTVVSATEITAITPARSTAGAVDVVITNADEQQVTATGAFTYTLDAAPTVTAVEPNNGTANGGTEVTITGTGFAPDAVAPTVTFGGTAATEVTVVSATEITATTPAHAAGDVDIVVTNPDTQEGTLTDGFEFLAAPPPVLSSIDPTSGDVTGGTTVTLTGSDFASAAKVSFGGIDADVDFVSATELTAVTPTRTAGAGEVDVVVTNPDGQIDTLAAAFTYTGTFPSVPTNAEIEAANKAVQDSVRVTRSGGTNTVSWDPDAVPDDAAGLQVWRIDSPAVWIADVVRGTAAFTSGEFLDTEGSETSKYLVTVFWDVAGTKHGYSTSAITTLPGYIGLSEKEVEDGATGIGGDGLLTQWWFWVLIGVGALVLILLVVLGVLLSRRGGRDDDESEWGEDDDLGWADEDAGFEPEEHGEEAWSEPPEAGEGRGEWAAGAAAGGHTEEVHTLECPNCQTQFTAGGAKPIVTTCPGCGKRGILR